MRGSQWAQGAKSGFKSTLGARHKVSIDCPDRQMNHSTNDIDISGQLQHQQNQQHWGQLPPLKQTKWNNKETRLFLALANTWNRLYQELHMSSSTSRCYLKRRESLQELLIVGEPQGRWARRFIKVIRDQLKLKKI